MYFTTRRHPPGACGVTAALSLDLQGNFLKVNQNRVEVAWGERLFVLFSILQNRPNEQKIPIYDPKTFDVTAIIWKGVLRGKICHFCNFFHLKSLISPRRGRKPAAPGRARSVRFIKIFIGLHFDILTEIVQYSGGIQCRIYCLSPIVGKGKIKIKFWF